MLITDAQIHLWEPERADRPWPKDGRTTPHRPNGFTAEQMLAEMDPVGVDRAIIVPPSWVGETNAYALEAVAAHPTRFAVMGRFDPAAPGSIAQLAGWLRQPGMLGIRVTFNTPTLVAGIDNGMFDPFWAACAQHGIPVMALFAGPLLTRVPPIVERQPELKLIIDHMGRIPSSHGPEAFADPRPAPDVGPLPKRVGQDELRAHPLRRVLSLPRHPAPPAADLRRLRGAAPALGYRHYPPARHLSRVPEPVPEGAGLPLGRRQGVDPRQERRGVLRWPENGR